MRLLDLFCGAGGAAMGYYRAGFDEIVGVDLAPMPRYPFQFVQADALSFLGWLIRSGAVHLFDAIHASPPCQGYSQTVYIEHEVQPEYPLLLAPTRELLLESGVPWILENVKRAPMLNPVELCGTALGLRVRRHRLFDSSHLLLGAGTCKHQAGDMGVYAGKVTLLGTHGTAYVASSGRTHYRPKTGTRADGYAAMGIDWMTLDELCESIPPAYTQWLGAQLIAAIQHERAA